MTRSTQSKMYSMPEKGNLKVGSDADIAIYDILPGQVDPSTEYAKIKKAFSAASYTLKSGEVVVKDGEIEETPKGKTYWVNAKIPEHRYRNAERYDRSEVLHVIINYMVELVYQKPVEIGTRGFLNADCKTLPQKANKIQLKPIT